MFYLRKITVHVGVNDGNYRLQFIIKIDIFQKFTVFTENKSKLCS